MTALNITAPTGQAPTVTFDLDLTTGQMIVYRYHDAYCCTHT